MAAMSTPDGDKVFAGTVPKIYETFLVPLIFQPYANDLAKRLAARPVQRVLEIAAGTGVVTRALADKLPESASIVATDLNQAMLEQAISVGTRRPVEWRQGDAMQLMFADASFDAVVCQFGVMFFPDKARAFAEVRRVLAPGGIFLFNAWDRIEENDFARVVTDSLASLFPGDPPRFMARTPHGYHDVEAITRDLRAAGFGDGSIDTLAKRSIAPSALDAAIAYCQGSPLRSEIESRGSLEEATRVAARAIESAFGSGAVDGKIQAHVCMVERD